MTNVAVRPAEHVPGPAERVEEGSGRGLLVFKVVIGLAVAASVVLRFVAGQALWLDEAQSVAIAKLPLTGEFTLFDGLRQDGSPPLYYLMLHAWIELFGTGTAAVRSLSALTNLVSAVPLYYLARRVVGENAARVSVLLYLTSPFALYFATETRMYSLIVLLTALGGLALDTTLRKPTPKSTVALALCAGGLALTHYWTLYLLLTVALWLVLVAAWPRYVAHRHHRHQRRPPAPSATPRPAPSTGLVAGVHRGSVGGGTGTAGTGTAGTGAAGGHRARLGGERLGGEWNWGSRGPLYGLVGIVGGGVVFAPWLGGFFYQLANTGTPWGEPASFAAISHAYGQWAGGPTTQGRLLLLIVTALVAFGIAGRAVDSRFVMLNLRGHEPGRTLFGLATVTLVVAVAAGKLVGNAWADRYTATAFVPFLLVVGLGATVLADQRVFRVVVATAAVIGLLAGAGDITRQRSQASEAADVIGRLAKPGDVVLVCPDQLGPGLARTLPSWVSVYAVPTYGPPDRVDWVDYETRNTQADGIAIADRAIAEAGNRGTVFMAASGSYRTFETLCLQVRTRLQQQRPVADEVMTQGKPAKVWENYALLRFQPS